jgi:hypothetical protein
MDRRQAWMSRTGAEAAALGLAPPSAVWPGWGVATEVSCGGTRYSGCNSDPTQPLFFVQPHQNKAELAQPQEDNTLQWHETIILFRGGPAKDEFLYKVEAEDPAKYIPFSLLTGTASPLFRPGLELRSSVRGGRWREAKKAIRRGGWPLLNQPQSSGPHLCHVFVFVARGCCLTAMPPATAACPKIRRRSPWRSP